MRTWNEHAPPVLHVLLSGRPCLSGPGATRSGGRRSCRSRPGVQPKPGRRSSSRAAGPCVPTHLTFQRHVVDLRVQQHGAGAERHRLVRDGPRRPAVNPQDLLLAGDNELFLEERSRVSRDSHGPDATRPEALRPQPPLTRSMLCCSRSFPRTVSCCLNSSFSGSAREGGGAICNHGGGVGGAVNPHPECPPSARPPRTAWMPCAVTTGRETEV